MQKGEKRDVTRHRKFTGGTKMGTLEALAVAVPQLKNIGSFNPEKLALEDKVFLFRVERVFIDAYGGDFKKFFGTVALIYTDAKKRRVDPETAIQEWITGEIQALRIDAHLSQKK